MTSPKTQDYINSAVEKTGYVAAGLITIGFFWMMFALIGIQAVFILFALAAVISIIKIGILWLL